MLKLFLGSAVTAGFCAVLVTTLAAFAVENVATVSQWQEAAGVLGAAGMSAFLAWRAGRRKERSVPYSPEKGSQPRIPTREEWHKVTDIVNVWPYFSERVRDHEKRLGTLERQFG